MHKKISILSLEYPAEALVLRVLCLVLAILSCLYLYFVAASVLNIIARRESDSHAAMIQSSIGDLEQQYFALSQEITPQEAKTLGLSPVTEQQFVYETGNAAAAPIPHDTIII